MKLNQKNRVTTPFGDFHVDVENLVDQLFGDRTSSSCSTKTSTANAGWAPHVSVMESDSDYRMVVELPGVDPANVNVEMQEGRLEISGEKRIAELGEGLRSVRDERQRGEFKRVFEFSKLVEPNGITAEYKNGLLEIVLPKSEKILPRKINIQVGS